MHQICISSEDQPTLTATPAIFYKDGNSGGAVTMKRPGYRSYSSIAVGIFTAILLVPHPALALDIRFVLDGVMGVFRGLEAGQTTDAPPAEAWLTFTWSSSAPEDGYSRAPICQLPDCGFISVDATGRNLTTPALFHGVNGGWQLLITPSSSGDSGRSDWPLYGSLFYCPGYESDGDPDACPDPTPETEPRSGPVTPMPHPDPGDSDAPGPLPILGVAAAYRCSRRLRKRLRGGLSGSSRTAAAPPGPPPAAG